MSTVRPRPALLAGLAAALVVGCVSPALTPRDDGGVEFATAATPERVRAEALALAAEMGHPARDRDGIVEVELSEGQMSERPSRWVRVAVEADGPGSTVIVTASKPVWTERGGMYPPPDDPLRRRTDVEAFTFAEALAERL